VRSSRGGERPWEAAGAGGEGDGEGDFFDEAPGVEVEASALEGAGVLATGESFSLWIPSFICGLSCAGCRCCCTSLLKVGSTLAAFAMAGAASSLGARVGERERGDIFLGDMDGRPDLLGLVSGLSTSSWSCERAWQCGRVVNGDEGAPSNWDDKGGG